MKNKDNELALDFLFSVINEEMERNFKKGATNQFSYTNENKILFYIKRKISPKIKQRIKQFFRVRKEFFVESMEKYFSLDFVAYIIKHSPIIPFSFFPKSDHLEIRKFIKNRFLTSLYDYINTDLLFDGSDVEKKMRYENFFKANPIKDCKSYFEFLGIKSITNFFDPIIFLDKYGLKYLSNIDKFKGATLIDCGAFIGDTTLMLNKEFSPCKIVAIEPDSKNYNNLLKNISINNLTNILPLQVGLSDENGELFIGLESSGVQLFKDPVKENSVKVKVYTIDELVKERGLENIKLIKMDIEGYEFSALNGAIETLRKFKPTLIISVYHRGKDFFEIPQLINKIIPEYKLRFINLSCYSPTPERVVIADIN